MLYFTFVKFSRNVHLAVMLNPCAIQLLLYEFYYFKIIYTMLSIFLNIRCKYIISIHKYPIIM